LIAEHGIPITIQTARLWIREVGASKPAHRPRKQKEKILTNVELSNKVQTISDKEVKLLETMPVMPSITVSNTTTLHTTINTPLNNECNNNSVRNNGSNIEIKNTNQDGYTIINNKSSIESPLEKSLSFTLPTELQRCIPTTEIQKPTYEIGEWVLRDPKDGSTKPNWVWKPDTERNNLFYGQDVSSGQKIKLKRPPKPRIDGISDEFWDDKPQDWYWSYIEQKTWRFRLYAPQRAPSNPVSEEMDRMIRRLYPDVNNYRSLDRKRYVQERKAVEVKRYPAIYYQWLRDRDKELEAKEVRARAEQEIKERKARMTLF